MSPLREAVLGMTLAVCCANVADGQRNEGKPFGGGAILIGAQGFARPPITSAVAAIYAHAPVLSALVGGQIGATFAEPRHAHASYAVATVAYAQKRAFSLQMYPYLAFGAAAFRTRYSQPQSPSAFGAAAFRAQHAEAPWRPAFGAGFGIDALAGANGRGLLLAARIGYLTRSVADDESIAYAAVGLGFGGRSRGAREQPRGVVAR